MKKLILACALAAMLVSLAACSGQAEQPNQDKQPPQIKWTNGCLRFMEQGRLELGSSESETIIHFVVDGDEWIVDWSYVPDPEHIWHRLYLSIYSTEEASDFTYMIDSSGAASGSNYIYADAGFYGVDIVAIGLESWKIIISLPESR